MPRHRSLGVLIVILSLLGGAGCSGGDGDATVDPAAPGGSATSTTASSEVTPTTSVPDLGAAETVAPDDATLIATSTWGVVPANRVDVLLGAGLGRADAEAVASAVGGSVVGSVELIGLFQIETMGTSEADLVAAIDIATSQLGVQSAGPETQLVQKQSECTSTGPFADPHYAEGDNARPYDVIGLKNAHDIIRASGIETKKVKIGVTDTGLMAASTEIDGSSSVAGLKPTDGIGVMSVDKNGVPDMGGLNHGTCVTHVIAADGNNGGVAGVASVLGEKLEVAVSDVFDGPVPPDAEFGGTAWGGRTLASLVAQINGGAKVINMSLGPIKPEAANAHNNEVYRRFFAKVHELRPDVVFVAAAGNEAGGLDGTNYGPGGLALPNVITVSAVDGEGNGANFTNRSTGGEVTIAAPGVDIPVGVGADGRTINASGTSFATPMVTGTIALLQSINPKLTATQIKQILDETAYAGVPARDGSDTSTLVADDLGGGVLRVDEAVLRVINDVRATAEPPQPPLDKEKLLQLANVTAVATPVSPVEFAVTARVSAVPDVGTSLTFELLGEGAFGGSSSVEVQAAPATAEWNVFLTEGQSAPTAKVCRTDVRACCTIYLEAIDLGGTWTGTLTIGTVDALDDIIIEMPFDQPPATITKEECEEGYGQLAGEAMPISLDFVADSPASGTVTMLSVDADGEESVLGPAAWTIAGGVVRFTLADGSAEDAAGVLVFEGRLGAAGDEYTLSGTWSAAGVPNLVLTGTFETSRPAGG
ncbi:MAG: S8 family serine peptidase [Acidimicrobiia bacterium]|nr:S8 family serine peptidase [Acidimicrobiia bacterium]